MVHLWEDTKRKIRPA